MLISYMDGCNFEMNRMIYLTCIAIWVDC